MSKTDRDRKPVIETGDWNPRYVSYAWSEGRLDPGEKLKVDRLLYPGGIMAGFMNWISNHWGEWKREFKAGIKDRDLILTDQDHNDFTSWLQKRYDR